MTLSIERTGRITGSRIGKILGKCPYGNRESVLREMVREIHGAETEFKGNVATQWGNDNEANAIRLYEEREGVVVHGEQKIIIHPTIDYLAVTPDGLVGSDGMIEVKCPYQADYTTIPDQYIDQVQLQLECTDREWSDFVIFRNHSIIVDRVYRDKDWLNKVMPEIKSFMAELQFAIENPEEHLSDKVIDMTSNWDWIALESEYKTIKDRIRDDEDSLKLLQRKFERLAGKKSAKGQTFHLIKSNRKGTIAYAKALKDLLPDADLSKYTGKPSTYFMIKEVTNG